jgi:hypothetical protein
MNVISNTETKLSQTAQRYTRSKVQQGVGNGLHFIKHNPFLGSMFTEVVGCNIPKVFLVGSEKERHEQFIMQFLNTSVIWGGGFVYDKVLENALFKPSKHYATMMADTTQAAHIKEAKQWHAMGKTAGMFGLIVPWMFTLPFLRNAFTVWNTGATNFAQMSGMQSYDRNDPQHQREEAKALRKNVGIFTVSNVAGMGIGLAGAVASRHGMDKTMQGEEIKGGLKLFKQGVEGLDKGFRKLPLIGSKDPKASILFKDGKFTNFDGLPLVASWIIPGYAGYLFSMRDPVEAFENVMNTAIALFSFEAGPTAIRKALEQKMLNNPQNPLVKNAIRNLGSVENTGTLSKMLVSTSLYGMLPTALSLITRPVRAKMVGLKDNDTTTGKPALEDRQPDVTRDPLPLMDTFTPFIDPATGMAIHARPTPQSSFR